MKKTTMIAFCTSQETFRDACLLFDNVYCDMIIENDSSELEKAPIYTPFLDKTKTRPEFETRYLRIEGIKSTTNGDRIVYAGSHSYRDAVPNLEEIEIGWNDNETVTPVIFGRETKSTVLDKEDYYSIAMNGVGIINTENLEWRHIDEIRKCPKSMGAIRDFRLMMYKEYKNCPRSMVEDELLRKIEMYRETAMSWSLETKLSTLEMVFSHKNAAAIAGFSTVLFGASITQSALLGFSATLGGVGVLAMKRRLAKKKLLNNDPIRYLVELQDKSQ